MMKNVQRISAIVLTLVWLPVVSCRFWQQEHNLKLNLPTGITQVTHLTDFSLSAVPLKHRDNDAGYPEWDDDLTFSFEQFPDTDELKQAKRAMLGVIDMLQTTMVAMYPGSVKITEPWPPPVATNSLKRYFFIDDLPQVAEVFKRLLAALGAPGFKELLDCYHQELLTLKVVYGDYWGSENTPLCQGEPDTSAYSTWEEDQDHRDGVFAVISLCRPFFDNYKDFSSAVDFGLFGADSIDQATAVNTYDLPCYTSSLTLLHDFLHWRAMGSSTLGYVIDDQIVFDPRFNRETKAYRAFYSMKMLDGEYYNKHAWTELSNVDNHVYAVQETYWGVRTKRAAVWRDPSPPPGYYPVNGPPRPGGA